MKIIISHDVDHLRLTEHWKDRFIPGVIYKSLYAWSRGTISLHVFIKRLTSNKLENVLELHNFNKENGVKETFFFGMRNALSLSYHYKKVSTFVKYLQSEGVGVGLHGIAYQNEKLLKEEKERLVAMLENNEGSIGIRNHYLRLADTTLSIMNDLKFSFDSTHYELKHPWKVGEMWEIPIGVMDAGLITHKKNNLEAIKKETVQRILEAKDMNLPFFVVNFHDIYFSEAYPVHFAWYKWLINYFRNEGFAFVSFEEAVDSLNKNGE